jgi:hypothetical protein
MRLAVIICSTAVLSINLAAVCNQPQPRLVCAEFFDSQVVVEATLVRSNYIAPANDMDGHIYDMQTEKMLRGKISPLFQIWEENSSGRATFGWKPGRSYLLFLHSKMGDGWVLDGCGNSGSLSHATAALKEIDAIRGARGGMIQVAVGGDFTTYSIEGAVVRASSSQGSYSSTTNKRGVAEIHVPSGEYRVVVSSKEEVRPFDLSYADPQKIVIEDGGCAQIQFVAEQQKK